MKIHWLSVVVAILLIALIIWLIVSQVKDHYAQKDDKLQQIKNDLKDVHPGIQHAKLYRGDKSYTINKEKIYLCLYDENGKYYPDNMLKYVFLHEFSHSINGDVGHTTGWQEKFDELLEKATELGVYDPSVPVIQNYCNHT